MNVRYSHAVLGGTFDHFHKGHEHIITCAFEVSEMVTIGIVGDTPLTHKAFSKSIEPYARRLHSIVDFVRTHGWERRLTVERLTDEFGTAGSNPTYDAIVVTEETTPTARKINQIRSKSDLPTLALVTCDFVKGDDRRIIRSTRIRNGSINRQGATYLKLFSQSHEMRLPKHLREMLREPLGEVIAGGTSEQNETGERAIQKIHALCPTLTIAVGDVVSDSLIANNFIPNISIRDFRTRRKSLHHSSCEELLHFQNPAGTLRRKVVQELRTCISQSLEGNKALGLHINGEEDLLALPAILFSPLESVVLYGQYGLGVVMVVVTEDRKEKVARILQKFE